MKHTIRVLATLLLMAAVLLTSCEGDMWRGYDQEDLTRYLTLGTYRGLSYTVADVTVTEEEIDEAIRQRLEASTELTATEEPIAEGTTVTFDRFCFLSGVSTPVLSEEGGTYRCGTSYEDPVIPALLSQMVGMVQGDTAELTVTLPEGYLGEGSPACEALYRVTVRALYVKRLPPLTDGLAATLMPGVETVEELRAALRAEKESEVQKTAERLLKATLWEQLVAESQLIERPFLLYQEQYSLLYGQYEALAAASSRELEEYLTSSLGMSLTDWEANLARQAEAAVKEALVLHSVVKQEQITCSEEELQAYAERCAREGDVFESGADYLAYYGAEAVTEQYLKEAVMDLMVAEAVPTS